MAKKNVFSELDDAALQRSLDAWERAVVASRVPGHIDIADRVRNAHIGEKLRRQRERAAEAAHD